MKGWAGFVRMGGVGDNLVAASVLRPLKRMGYMTEVITSKNYSTVYLNNPHLDSLVVKDDKDVPPGGKEWWQFWEGRAKEYELFANFSFSMEATHAWHYTSAPFHWPAEYRRRRSAGNYLETVHDILGCAHDFGPLFFPTEEEQVRAAEVKQRVAGNRCIAWILAGSRVDKKHPYAGLAIARTIKELGIPVMMVGSGAEQFQYAKATEAAVKRANSSDDGLSLAMSDDNKTVSGDKWQGAGDGQWPIRRSLSQVLAADLVVSPDTGMAWAAAFEKMPKVIMLSHASPENITKHWVNATTLHADQDRVPCWPCHRLHDDMSTCVPDKDLGAAASCMMDITVEDILEAINKAWHWSGKVLPFKEAAE